MMKPTILWNGGTPMGDNALRAQKQALRRLCAEKRAAMTPQFLFAASESIARRVSSSEAFCQAEGIFSYVSLPNEPDTRALIELAWAKGKRVYVPRCRGKGLMEAVAVSSWQDLLPGALGILEPREEILSEPAPAISLALVPCVCAGLDGRRLGHGAGYYDRFLKFHPTAKICLCFHALLFPDIPMDAQDVWMDAVVTENGWFQRKK